MVSSTPRRAPAFGEILFGVCGEGEGVAGEREVIEEGGGGLPKMGGCVGLDKVGIEAKAMWGAQWVDKSWAWVGAKDCGLEDEDGEKRKKAEEERNFEEQLKKEIIILMFVDPAELDQVSAERQLVSISKEVGDVLDEDTKPEVDNQEEERNEDCAGFLSKHRCMGTIQWSLLRNHHYRRQRMWPRRNADDDSSEDEENNARHLHDWANPSGPKKRSLAEAAAAWAPSTEQPLMELLGMTLFQFKYDAGVVERSMRRWWRGVCGG